MKEVMERYIGETEYLRERYKNVFGNGDYDKQIEEIQKQNQKKYVIFIIIAIVSLVTNLYLLLSQNNNIVVDDEGFVTSISRPTDKSAQNLSLKVYGISEEGNFVKTIDVNILSEKELEKSEGTENSKTSNSQETNINKKVSELKSTINNNKETKIVLPTELQDGTKVKWQVKKSDYTGLICIGFGLLFVMIYRDRFSNINKKEKELKSSVVNALPEFINKLALLMGAGLTFNTAFVNMMSEVEKNKWQQEEMFYSQMLKIKNDMLEKNAILHREIMNFAKRTQNRAFIRIANIIGDNISKGTKLTEKLTNENTTLWFERKKHIQEVGYLAETKMIGPLVLLLGVLVFITVMPAMLEM